MFLALDKHKNERVAIKQLRMIGHSADSNIEWKVLKSCNAKSIVRYYDALIVDDSLWVPTFGCSDDVDRYGVLYMWVSVFLLWWWYATEGERTV